MTQDSKRTAKVREFWRVEWVAPGPNNSEHFEDFEAAKRRYEAMGEWYVTKLFHLIEKSAHDDLAKQLADVTRDRDEAKYELTCYRLDGVNHTLSNDNKQLRAELEYYKEMELRYEQLLDDTSSRRVVQMQKDNQRLRSVLEDIEGMGPDEAEYEAPKVARATLNGEE